MNASFCFVMSCRNEIFRAAKALAAFALSNAIIFMFDLGAVNRNHFLRLYTVAASNNILLVAFIPTVAKRLKIKNVEKKGF
ncbi:MAG: hypothetical protein WKF85_14630 [Chitinophagaceae bacterium]